MAMIPLDKIHGKRFLNGRTSNSPVIVIDSLTFRLPPAARGEREHKIQLDDQERPAACSCTCEKGMRGDPCWAMSRVLAVVELLGSNNIFVSRDGGPSWLALLNAASAVERPATARVAEGGDLALNWGEQPQAGMLYKVSR